MRNGSYCSHHRSYARTRQSDSRRDFGVPHIASLLHLLSVPKTQRAPRSGRFVLFISSLASLRTGRSLRPPSSGRVGRRGRAVAAPRSERGSGRVGVHAGSTDRPAGQGVGESEQVSVCGGREGQCATVHSGRGGQGGGHRDGEPDPVCG